MQEKIFKQVPTAEELFERVKNNKANVSKHPWKDWGISREEWVEYLQDRIRKDIEAPKEGDEAPDFSEFSYTRGHENWRKLITSYLSNFLSPRQ